MNPPRNISERVLAEMHDFLENEKFNGQKAAPDDLLFMIQGYWLKDAAVIDVVRCRDGAWDVDLVFAHYKKPLQFIVRHITRQFSEQKAQASAFYMRKIAAKDSRGTLTVSIDDLDLCRN